MLAWHRRQQVESSVTAVRAVLQQSQRRAIQQSTSCTVTVPTGVEPTVSSTCVSNEQLEGTEVSTESGSDANFGFSFRGTVTDPQTVVLASTETDYARCIAVSLLGATRVGNWNGSQCKANSKLN